MNSRQRVLIYNNTGALYKREKERKDKARQFIVGLEVGDRDSEDKLIHEQRSFMHVLSITYTHRETDGF